MITISELFLQLGQKRWPLIYDLRGDEEVAAISQLLPAARRVAQDQLLDSVRRDLQRRPGARVIVQCQKGGPRAECGAALLRSEGIPVDSLEGGITAWVAANGPTVSAAKISELPVSGSRWVTRARPKIDRIACPWLIKRFVDQRAAVHYVAPATVDASARLLQATPFDIDGAAFSHDGEKCSFDVFIERFEIKDDALDRIALIVRGADTGRLDLAPEASGLLAMSLGLSAANASDEAMLAEAETLYDGLYAWARHAAAEQHDWRPKK
jgi:rhodanese-related sulfurtransferase